MLVFSWYYTYLFTDNNCSFHWLKAQERLSSHLNISINVGIHPIPYPLLIVPHKIIFIATVVYSKRLISCTYCAHHYTHRKTIGNFPFSLSKTQTYTIPRYCPPLKKHACVVYTWTTSVRVLEASMVVQRDRQRHNKIDRRRTNRECMWYRTKKSGQKWQSGFLFFLGEEGGVRVAFAPTVFATFKTRAVPSPQPQSSQWLVSTPLLPIPFSLVTLERAHSPLSIGHGGRGG